MSIRKLGILATVVAMVALFAAVRPGMNTPKAEADFVTSGGISAIPSAAPGIPGLTNQAIPAIIPASGDGNHAIISVFFPSPDPTVSNCVSDLLQLGCRVTFKVQAMNLATGALGPTGAKFLASGSDTLVCTDGAACDIVNPGVADGAVVVKLAGGGKDELLDVSATEGSTTTNVGQTLHVNVITTQTMQALPPVLEPNTEVIPGLQDLALVSYSCGTNVGRSVFNVGGPAETVDTLEEMWAGIYAGETQVTFSSTNPFYRCGGDTSTTVDDFVQFQTDIGMLSVDPIQTITMAVIGYPFVPGDCDEGSKVAVNDGGIWSFPFPMAGIETCDLDAAPNGVVTYAVLRTPDAVGVATIQGQQGTLAGTTRSTNVDFVGTATMIIDLSNLPDAVGVLAPTTLKIAVLSTAGGTGPSPVAGVTVACSVSPANSGFALTPDRDTTGSDGIAEVTLVPTGIPGSKLTITCSAVNKPEIASVSKEISVTLTPDLESVDLVTGCNPVAATWAKGTAIKTVADAVSPASALDAIWKFDPATGTWMGYSPTAPAGVSNLSTVDRLDAIFVCVNAAATISRPVI